MRAWGRTILAVIACFGLVNACMAGERAIRLVTLDYPPYIYDVRGRAEGPIPAVVTEVFRRMGKPVTIEFLPWSRALVMASNGDVDGLFTIKKTPEREPVLVYPREPLLTQDYVFFASKQGSFRFDGNYSSIANARIGVVRNTSYGARFDAALKQGVFAQVEVASDYERIFRMLLAGRVDMVICSRLVGMNFLRQLDPDERIAPVSGPPSETALSYLVFSRRSEAAALAEAFDQALSTMRKDGTLARLMEVRH